MAGETEAASAWNGWAIQVAKYKVQLLCFKDNGTVKTFTTVLDANTDYLIGVQINKSSGVHKLFINGQYIESISGGAISMGVANTFFVGYSQAQTMYSTTGTIDQTIIVDGELTPENITKLYNGGLGC